MFVIDSKDKEFRHGDHGPKYLMQGPRSSFAICRLRPGEVLTSHKHKVMEEVFYMLKGQLIVEVGGVKTCLEEGQMIMLEPGEFHTLTNPGDDYNEYVITCAPFAPNDKYMNEDD